MERVKLKETAAKGGGRYFSAPAAARFIPTGCSVLDCVLGGGWRRGRCANIVGDSSAGKTLLGIEASANFINVEPDGEVHFREIESAFDVAYAENIGLPVDRVDFGDEQIDTVEELFDDMLYTCDRHKKTPKLYIVDSLDALTDKAEKKRAIGEATYGGGKAKQMGQLFRRLIRKLEKRDVTVIIISQTRDNIGVSFGKTWTRSGGKALDFYASQVVYLKKLKKIVQTRHEIERKVGINIRAMCEKNKVSDPYHECTFPIYFKYGIEEVEAGINFLRETKKLSIVGMNEKAAAKFLKRTRKMDTDDFAVEREKITQGVREAWAIIEKSFAPVRRKYG